LSNRPNLPHRLVNSKTFLRVWRRPLSISDKRVEMDERIAALINSQIHTEENVKKTDEHLRNLIAVVDRYFSEGRNGNVQS